MNDQTCATVWINFDVVNSILTDLNYGRSVVVEWGMGHTVVRRNEVKNGYVVYS